MAARRVVIVEDDRVTNDRLRILAESLGGVEVEQAFDCLAAEKLISSQDFDLALIDIDLGPDLINQDGRYSGLALLPALAEKGVITIVVTGMAEINLPPLAFRLKAYDFIPKPIRDPELIHKMKLAFELGKARGKPLLQMESAWPADVIEDPSHTPGLMWKRKPVRLTLTQLRITYRLLNSANSVVGVDELSTEMGTATSKSALATHITDIRAKFKAVDSKFSSIRNVPGRGYVWKSTAE